MRPDLLNFSRSPVTRLLLTGCFVVVSIPAAAQSDFNPFKDKPEVGPIHTRDVNDPFAEPPTPDTPYNRYDPVPIYFPAHPPPLGAVVNTPPDDPHLDHPILRELNSEMLEPYFPQLSSRLTEPHARIGSSLRQRFEKRRERRERLLAELRRTIEAVADADAKARHAAFAALARKQEPALRKLEVEAESLRRRLASRVDWYELRRWNLGSGPLDLPREKLRDFEYQVVRATAFYRDGLTPAQRRLLRESLQVMDQSAEAEGPAAEFIFFSPDMMRVRFPPSLPANLAERISGYVTRKDAIRRQLRDAAYRSDFAGSGYSRRKQLLNDIDGLAEPLDALEDDAEQIRIELATTDGDWRQPRPPSLPVGLLAMIDEYLLGKHMFRRAYDAALHPVAAERPPKRIPVGSDEYVEWKVARGERVAAAREEFMQANASDLAALNSTLQEIDEALAPHLVSEDLKSHNEAPDAVLTHFLKRYRRELAFHEYDIAAFEPGLSLRQRNLLLAGAVVRLRLPPAGPELQPEAEPRTILPPN